MEKKIRRYNRQFPLWFRIKETGKICATIFGVDAYMENNMLESCTLESVQKFGNVWEVVNTKWNGQTRYARQRDLDVKG